MKIIVYDIAVSKGGGGESILDQYFNQAISDTENEWWFFVSLDKYKNAENDRVHVVYVDVKSSSKIKSYFLRKKYEIFELKKAIKAIEPDEVISLQNMVVPWAKCKQTVYLHQSFQFAPVKYSFFRKEERSFAFRQHIVCWFIKHNLHKADKVIVQTNWMKKAVAEWVHYPEEQIVVERPVFVPLVSESKIEKLNNVFFFPAHAYLNKNHQVIIEACKLLKKKGINDYHVQFTFSPDSGIVAKKLFNEIQKEELPIEFIGHLDKKTLFQKYQTSIMLFPSYVETFGLPLLESKTFGGRIIASNLPFAHEILDGYDSVTFVEWNDASAWADAIESIKEITK